jgi:sec-independent protein translocase protein TatA
MAWIDTPGTRRYIPRVFGISGEHLLILGIVLLIFGPRRLPELGNTLGKAIRNFKDAVSGVEEAKFRRLEEEKAASAQPQPPVQPAATATATSPRGPAQETAEATTPGQTEPTGSRTA